MPIRLLFIFTLLGYTTFLTAQQQSDEVQRGTCVVAAWHGTSVAVAADPRTVDTIAITSGGRTTKVVTTPIDCKVVFASAKILVSAVGATSHPDDPAPVWDAKKSGVSLAREIVGPITSEKLVAVATKWQIELEKHWKRFAHKDHYGDDHHEVVSLILLSKNEAGIPIAVEASFEALDGKPHRLDPVVIYPPPDGHTGMIPFGECSNYAQPLFFSKNYLPEEARLYNYIADVKLKARSTVELTQVDLEFEKLASTISGKLHVGKDDSATIAPPYDSASMEPNSTVWKLMPSSTGCKAP